jgi:hypothetical protein
MKQIITGPFGRVAYHDACTVERGQYPALNLPCLAFARGKTLVAANEVATPCVISLPRQMRTGAALAMFGSPVKREN